MESKCCLPGAIPFSRCHIHHRKDLPVSQGCGFVFGTNLLLNTEYFACSHGGDKVAPRHGLWTWTVRVCWALKSLIGNFETKRAASLTLSWIFKKQILVLAFSFLTCSSLLFCMVCLGLGGLTTLLTAALGLWEKGATSHQDSSALWYFKIPGVFSNSSPRQRAFLPIVRQPSLEWFC